MGIHPLYSSSVFHKSLQRSERAVAVSIIPALSIVCPSNEYVSLVKLRSLKTELQIWGLLTHTACGKPKFNSFPPAFSLLHKFFGAVSFCAAKDKVKSGGLKKARCDTASRGSSLWWTPLVFMWSRPLTVVLKMWLMALEIKMTALKEKLHLRSFR